MDIITWDEIVRELGIVGIIKYTLFGIFCVVGALSAEIIRKQEEKK